MYVRGTKRRPKIYVSGPYTKGDPVVNTRIAVLQGDWLYGQGFIPFIPHLTHLWHMITPRSWEDWLDMDKEWVLACDGILRLPGESKGADMECDLAAYSGITVFYDTGTLERYFKNKVLIR